MLAHELRQLLRCSALTQDYVHLCLQLVHPPVRHAHEVAEQRRRIVCSRDLQPVGRLVVPPLPLQFHGQVKAIDGTQTVREVEKLSSRVFGPSGGLTSSQADALAGTARA